MFAPSGLKLTGNYVIDLICRITPQYSASASVANKTLLLVILPKGVLLRRYLLPDGSEHVSPGVQRIVTCHNESIFHNTWWRHQMETFSALLAICVGNSPVPGEFPTQRPVTQSFDVFFALRLNKRLSKQWWVWWFETLSHPLWRHRNEQLL